MGPKMALLNELLNSVRLAHGLKLETIAAETRFSTSHVARIMAGEARVSIEFLEAFSDSWPNVTIARSVFRRLDIRAHDGTAAQSPAKRIPPPRHSRHANKFLCEVMRRLLSSLEHTDAIVADGQVNAQDDPKLAECLEDLDAVEAAVGEFRRSLSTWRDLVKSGAGQ